jgi:hypothetical protein
VQASDGPPNNVLKKLEVVFSDAFKKSASKVPRIEVLCTF